MIGAMLGDIIGSPYEFDKGHKTKNFPLFSEESHFTDDTVMTVAVAEALLTARHKRSTCAGKNTWSGAKFGVLKSDTDVKKALIDSMVKWGSRYPNAGYGGRFYHWLFDDDGQTPYNSYGNGSAMRVSPAGWLYNTLEETRRVARLTAEVSHNHPEGIKGAEAVASAIYLAREGAYKEEIKAYVTKEFGYDLTRTCDEIRPSYRHVETCQQTVPEAFAAFFEGKTFEDVIRTAVSLGGDCDTLTCIAGSIAEAYYDVPGKLVKELRKRIPAGFKEVLDYFIKARRRATTVTETDSEGNEIRVFMFSDEYPGDNYTWWPKEGLYNGYTKKEASEKAKEVMMSLKDKLWQGFFSMELWKDSDFVMDIVREGGEENFRDMVKRGDLKNEDDYMGYEWRLTN